MPAPLRLSHLAAEAPTATTRKYAGVRRRGHLTEMDNPLRGRASGRLPRAMASPPIPPPGSLQFKLVKTFVDLNVRVYRLTGGRLGGKVKRAPVLLLDHLGRKTGRARTTPVLYLRDGADLVIVGSRGGSDAMPAWLLNLMSSPSTTVQVGSERRAVVAPPG